jgi:tRNA (guanine37-N1)-methyltransferase
MMKIDILTLFPDFFDKFLTTSIIKRASAKKVVKISTTNIRDFTEDKHKRVDDYSVGGGAGLIMKVQPIFEALKSLKAKKPYVILTSPRGKRLDQKLAIELKTKKHLVIICGHYEGVDERVLSKVDMEVSLGDFIMTGGEIPAMAITDAVTRLLAGSITADSLHEESFDNGLLEYPQYTLPREYNKLKVPEILFSGNHREIKKWRLKESLRKTMENRPDLLKERPVDKLELDLLLEISKDKKIADWEKSAINKAKKFTKK